MKYYTYAEPTSATDSTPIYHTLSEDEIIEEYWDHFIEGIKKRGGDPNTYCKWDCIDTWVVVHWAWESGNE